MRMQADPTLLHEALANLFDTALRYGKRGGRMAVALDAISWTEVAEMRVIDDGPGIPAAARDQVLTRFGRLPTSPSGGTVLGLSIVRDLVHAHGGRLRLDDGPEGHGLCVHITLPITLGKV